MEAVGDDRDRRSHSIESIEKTSNMKFHWTDAERDLQLQVPQTGSSHSAQLAKRLGNPRGVLKLLDNFLLTAACFPTQSSAHASTLRRLIDDHRLGERDDEVSERALGTAALLLESGLVE